MWTMGMTVQLLPFYHWYFVIETLLFQHSNFSKVDKMIYNSISDTCLIVFAPKLTIKWSVFEPKHCSNSTKCPVNKLKVAAFTASFLQRDVIESCVALIARWRLILPLLFVWFTALPPPMPPALSVSFLPLIHLLDCDIMLHIIRMVLKRTAATRSRSGSEMQFEKVDRLFSTMTCFLYQYSYTFNRF